VVPAVTRGGTRKGKYDELMKDFSRTKRVCKIHTTHEKGGRVIGVQPTIGGGVWVS